MEKIAINSKFKSIWSVNHILLLAFSLRLVLVFYSKIHDYAFKVSFTDIDYRVYSDAAALVWSGKSPYDRPTYRYTPFLAWILVPNVVFPEFGKILFCLVDVIVGWLLYLIILRNSPKSLSNSQPLVAVSVLWLFNPLVAVISARGNADTIVCLAVLCTLYFIDMNSSGLILSAIVHGGLAVHFKIYPLIYLPSIFISLIPSSSFQSNSIFSRMIFFILNCFKNKKGFIYVLVSLMVFSNILIAGYLFYGNDFLEQFLFYHLKRRDIHHNFSPYFYPFYLTMNDIQLSRWLSFAAFLPQILCIFSFALKYSNDLPFCWFLTTYSFVSFNKVCTSQYFIWYLCLLPLIYQRVDISIRRSIFLLMLWFVGQVNWLLPAYLLEFQGYNTFIWIWISSQVFLSINIYIMSIFIKNYSPLVLDKNTSDKKFS